MIQFSEEIIRASFSRRTDRQTERFWLCPPDSYTAIGFPLQFAKTGYSIWKRRACTERDDYASFGIELVCAGDASNTFKGRTVTVGAGSAFLKLPGHGHRYETGSSGFLHKRFINMHGAGLASWVEMLGLGNCPVIEHIDGRWFVERQREAAAIIASRDPAFSIALAAVMYLVLLQIGAWVSESQWPVGLRDAVAFMQGNVRRVCSVAEVVQSARLSVPSLHRAFRKQLGTSPQKYLRDMKMRVAADMLLHTTMPVKNIAFDLGYENPFAFSTQFRKTMGTPPRQYRQNTLPEYEKAEKA